jgi:hypothetical protein
VACKVKFKILKIILDEKVEKKRLKDVAVCGRKILLYVDLK